MAYLISIGSTVCGTTAIMATAPVIKANKNEVSYAIANITLIKTSMDNGHDILVRIKSRSTY